MEFIIALDDSLAYNVNGTVLHLKKGDGVFANSRQLHFGYSVKNEPSLCAFLLIHPILLCSCEAFKTHMNQTPIIYLMNYRIDKSMELLENTDLSMSEICYEVGFSGASYYSEKFRELVGCSPRDYRKRVKKLDSET